MKSKQETAKGGAKPVRCEDIQALLMDYHGKELGAARSEYVREHLRFCIHCQQASSEIMETLDLLRKADDAAKTPDRLTEKRRNRIWWWLAHPFMRWIERHHVAVSWGAVIFVLLLIAAMLLRIEFLRGKFVETWYEVNVGVPARPLPPQDAAPAGNEAVKEEVK